MLNCPNTVASSERNFSKLKLIKTFNRSHMTNGRLSSLKKDNSETGRSSVEILLGECSLYSNCLVQSSFLFGVETAFPHLFFQHYTLYKMLEN